jgi:hypothetical protein
MLNCMHTFSVIGNVLGIIVTCSKVPVMFYFLYMDIMQTVFILLTTYDLFPFFTFNVYLAACITDAVMPYVCLWFLFSIILQT